MKRKPSLRRFVGRDGVLACDVLKLWFLHRFLLNQKSFSRRISSVVHQRRHPKNECTPTFDLKVTLCYYYTEPLDQTLYMKSDWFLTLSNSASKVVPIGKNYSKVGVVLRVNNEVVVKIWMTKRCTADCTSTSLHGLAYFVIHPSACFVGVCQYVGWMINFLCIKLHQKSSSKFYRREGVGLWRTLQWHFPFQNRFTSGPKQIFASIGEKSKNLRLFFVVIKDLAKTETG